MNITDNLTLENSAHGFKLIQWQDGKRNGVPCKVEKSVREYGTIYQALISILNTDYDVEHGLKEQFRELCDLIEAKESEIKEKFRIEVRATK